MVLEEPMATIEGLLRVIAHLKSQLREAREENEMLTAKRMGKRALCNAVTKRLQAGSIRM